MFVISGVTGGFLILLFFAALAVALGILACRYYKEDKEEYGPQQSDRVWVASLGSAIIVLFVLLTSILFYGFDFKYAQVYRGTGTVQEITNVMTNGSGVTTTKPLVKFEESDDLFSFLDSRVATYTGYELDIRCTLKKGWVSMDEYHCTVLNINDRGEK